MKRNAFEVLGIATNASLLEIRRVYRQKVRDCHPDLAGDEAIEKFLAVQNAYEILRSDKKRAVLGKAKIFSSFSPKKFDQSTRILFENLVHLRGGHA